MDDHVDGALSGPGRTRSKQKVATVLVLAAMALAGRHADAWAVGAGPIDTAAGSLGALTVAVLLIVVIAVLVAPHLYAWLRRVLPLFKEREDVPLLVFRLSGDGAWTTPDFTERGNGESDDTLVNGRQVRLDVEAVEHDATAQSELREVQRAGAPYGHTTAPMHAPAPLTTGAAVEHGVAAAPASGATGGPGVARSDETLQLLPGRLVVVSGAPADQAQEIRFVRSGTVTEITLGRAPGSAIGHVQLRAPTVSRRHARLRYEKGRWTIVNLSRTNPLRINGEELEAAGEHALAEGDRIELSEMSLVFHER